MDVERSAVTVIGLGSMGSALAAALLERGHTTTVWNRTEHRMRPLADRGARPAATAAEAVAASPLVLTCVLDHDALRSALGPAEEALAGRTLVDLGSGTPEQAHDVAAWARAHGADHLDGAIMTTPPGVGGPDPMFLYSGPRAAFDTHRPTLAALGDPLYLGTDPGLASLHDAALLGLMWSTMTGWLHGTALVGAEGTKATDFTPLAIRWLHTVTGFLSTYADQVDAGRYPGDDATVDVQIAAITHLLHAADARGIDNALPALLKATMQRAHTTGHGSDSYASIIEVLKNSEAGTSIEVLKNSEAGTSTEVLKNNEALTSTEVLKNTAARA